MAERVFIGGIIEGYNFSIIDNKPIINLNESKGMEYWSLQDDHAIASIRCNDGTVIVGYLKFEDVYPLSHNSYTNNIVMISFHISHLNDVITFSSQ